MNKEDIIGYLSERQYLTFVLGYDLLQKKFAESECYECDRVYDKCSDIAKMFYNSEKYQEEEGLKYSTYELLDIWLRENSKMIDEIVENEEWQ